MGVETMTIGMTPEQWQVLINTLKEIAESLPLRNYTLTGAVDWYWIVVLAVALSAWLGYIHQDLKNSMQTYTTSLKEEKEERTKNDDKIWEAFGKCQAECLKRRQGDK